MALIILVLSGVKHNIYFSFHQAIQTREFVLRKKSISNISQSDFVKFCLEVGLGVEIGKASFVNARIKWKIGKLTL